MITSLYVHIPFCKKKCLYCDFNSFDNKSEKISRYMEALYKEIESYSFNKLETIYIGGGTPSFIDSSYIVRLLSMLPSANEVTIEMNPCTVTIEKLETYRKAGVNRVSIGLQTTNDNILKEIGRAHSFEDFKKAYGLIRNAGFTNVNVDLMFGLPNQTLEDLKESVDYLISINPEHISSVIHKLKQMNCKIGTTKDTIYLKTTRDLIGTNIKTMPYPGFPTDMQSQFVALLSTAYGTSIVVENIFENRFKYVNELIRMGANITLESKTAVIQGVNKLYAASVCAKELRGGAALVLAGLCADGISTVNEIEYLERGYENLIQKLSILGAKIQKK